MATSYGLSAQLDHIKVKELPKELLSPSTLEELHKIVKDQINATYGLMKIAEAINSRGIPVPDNLIEAYNHMMIAGRHLCCIPDEL